MPRSPSPSDSCPFCGIASSYPPIQPSSCLPKENGADTSNHHEQKHHNEPLANSLSFPSDDPGGRHAHLVLSTESILAFLDIMPLTKGHLLVITRDHYEKLGDLNVETGREVCLLPSFLFFYLYRITKHLLTM